MKLKEIISNTIWFGIIPKLTILVTLLITPLITPYLTPDDYGVIGIISAYVGTITGFATLGLHVHLTNSYYEYKLRFGIVWRRLIFWMAMGALGCMIVGIFILWIVLPDVSPWPRWMVVGLATLSILFSFNIVIAQHYYNLRLHPKPLVIRNMLAALCGLGVMFFIVYQLRWGYMGYVISTAVSAVVTFLLFIYPLWYKLKLFPYPNPVNKRVKGWIKVAIPLMPHNVGHILLSSGDRIIMSILMVSTYEIGIYSNGYSFGEYGSVLILALTTALSPVMQTSFRSNNYKQIRKLLFFTEGISLLIIMGLSIWMREIYQIMVRNEELQVCHHIAGYTCFSFAMFPLYSILSVPTFVEKKTWQLLWLIFIPALLNIVLNFIFIPIYGYRAAILTTIISYWSICFIALLVPYYREHLRNWLGNPFWVVCFFGGGFFILAISQFIGRLSVLNKGIITCIFLFICCCVIVKKWQNLRDFNFVHSDIN